MANEWPTPAEIAEMQRHVGYGSAWLGPVLVSGQGSRVTDIDGKSYIDCTAQAWTLALGYNHPEVVETAVAQVRTLPHVRAGFPTLPRLRLAKRLAELCPGRLDTVTYAPTGSLGIETAMKLALVNRPGAQRFVTFYHAYHGNTFATMAASWSPTRTPGHFGPGVKFLPFMQHVVRVPNPYCYRCPDAHQGSAPAPSVRRLSATRSSAGSTVPSPPCCWSPSRGTAVRSPSRCRSCRKSGASATSSGCSSSSTRSRPASAGPGGCSRQSSSA